MKYVVVALKLNGAKQIGRNCFGRATDKFHAENSEIIEKMTYEQRQPKDGSHEEQQTHGDLLAASANIENEVLSKEGPDGSTNNIVKFSRFMTLKEAPRRSQVFPR